MTENEDFKVEGQWVLGRDDPACAIVAQKINSIATSFSDVMARERRVAILLGLGHCRNPKTNDPLLIKARSGVSLYPFPDDK